MIVLHMKRHGQPLPVTGIVLLLYMYMMFVPHKEHWPSRCIADIDLVLTLFVLHKNVLEIGP
jgi:hypothetical protein